MKRLLIYFSAFIQTACLSAFFGSQDPQSDRYRLGHLDANWEKIDPAGADQAYRHRQNHSVFSISSACGDERLRSLEDLLNDMQTQLSNVETTSPPAYRTIEGHAVILSETKGNIDGQPMTMRAAVLRSKRCIYDFVLAGPNMSGDDRASFDQLLQSFRETK